MKKTWKKTISALLTLAMVTSVAPVTAMAEEVANEPVVAEQAAVVNVAETGGTEYETLAAAVAAAASGATVTLLKDAEGAGIVIDKNITINFGGKTYNIIGPAVGSKGTTTLGFQILSGNDVVLENGKITESAPAQNEGNETDEAVKMLVQNYADLTLNNMVLDGSELDGEGRYTLSNNCGEVLITGKTKIIADDNKGVAFDACEYSSYPVPEVTVEEGSVVDGKIEVTGTAKLVIEGGSFTDLANAVKYAEDGAEITLLENVKGAGIVIDKDITIDFNDKTYDIVGPAVGSAGTTTLGFQILSGNTVVLEDGKITESAPAQNGENETDEAVKMLVQNYANLTLNNMVLDGSELDGEGRYTLSNNSGTVLIKETKIIADENGIAFDACEYASYPVPEVTVDKNSVVDGKMEVTGTAKLVIEGGSFTDLANAVKYAVSGATVTLLKDVKGAGIVIDKDITIDFDGNTYDIVGPAVGSAGTTTLGFQILSGNDVVLKDGTITESAPAQNGENETDKAVKMLVQNYSNLTVENMKLDGSNLGGTGRYVLSNNCGTIAINSTEIIAPENGIAFDVCKYASYEAPTVTIKNASAKGAFEVSEGLEGNLKIESGYFTQDPTAYVVEGKVVTASNKDGYTYMVGDPAPAPTPSKGGSSKPKYTASVDKDDVENGDVKLSNTKAKAGSKVTVTVTPDEGYELKKLQVLDKNGDKVEVTDNGDGTFTFKMPKGGVEVVPVFVEAEEQEPAEDADTAEKTTLVLTIGQTIYQMDGNYAANDAAPIISGDRTFLPIRLIAESLGATVGWDEAEQSVTIVRDGTMIVLYIGQAFATVNGEPVQLDAPAFLANDRTYLPVRFVAENLGATVSWDAETNKVTIIG